jgi:hypothetical protein
MVVVEWWMLAADKGLRGNGVVISRLEFFFDPAV